MNVYTTRGKAIEYSARRDHLTSNKFQLHQLGRAQFLLGTVASGSPHGHGDYQDKDAKDLRALLSIFRDVL